MESKRMSENIDLTKAIFNVLCTDSKNKKTTKIKPRNDLPQASRITVLNPLTLRILYVFYIDKGK